MAEYIDKSALYEKIAQLEEIARNRYLETPSSNPCCSRYMTQLNERTVFKHIIADFPAADVAPVRHGKWERVIPLIKRNYLTEGGKYFRGYTVADVNQNYNGSDFWREIIEKEMGIILGENNDGN